ncbi:MAG TPA: class E sortase [Gaiellaceae bacterium]|jgi:sortase A
MATRIRTAAASLLAAAAILVLAWVLLVWLWRDPFTSVYTAYEQHKLAGAYDARVARLADPGPGSLADIARRYRTESKLGDPIGRLHVDRLGLNMVLLNGTDEATLRKGPGRDRRSAMPGEGKLVYVAGHRTTYLAPFSHIERLRPGDPIVLEVPYATFTYEVVGHEIVVPTDLSVLRPGHRELLRLQACHPRFFATRRYIVTARLVRVKRAGDATSAAAGTLEAWASSSRSPALRS